MGVVDAGTSARFHWQWPSYPLREVWLLLLSRLIVRPARDLKVVNVYVRGEGRLGRWTLVSVDDGVARGRVKNVVAWM